MSVALLSLALATLVSEDLTLLATSALIARGSIGAWEGVFACALGIFVGDLLLYGVGRLFGPRVLAWRRLRRAVSPAQLAAIRGGLNRRLAVLIVASRFVPGTRLALYVTSGALSASPWSFAGWCAVAVAIWTPILVLGAAQALPVVSSNWPAQILGLGLLLTALRGVQHVLGHPTRRAQALARLSLLWRWEFWPMWLFYAPVAAWIALLIVRYRGVGALRAANPGMRDGGIVGESKYEILEALPATWTAPTLLIPVGVLAERMRLIAGQIGARGWKFPLVFKPDVGQRGAGVKLIRGFEHARRYLEKESRPVVVQPFHPGPYEAGVFYYRLPSWSRGRILSITDKQFPAAVGDGVTTLEQLIWNDSRLRMQAHTFLARHADRRQEIPAAGERVALVMAGNHCQGTLFRDGQHLITKALEDRIDAIAREYVGFFIGRFDIRYTDVERFKAGEDFTIIELNGTTAESTNIYDPDGSLFAAYRQLFRQWQLVFEIGAANLALGSPSISLEELLRLVRAQRATPGVFAVAD